MHVNTDEATWVVLRLRAVPQNSQVLGVVVYEDIQTPERYLKSGDNDRTLLHSVLVSLTAIIVLT